MNKKRITSHQVNYGKRIAPIKTVELFSADEWEDFIEEWTELKKSLYFETEKFGGAGDKGRDVVGYKSDKNLSDYKWDCFQCKHYETPLRPTQVYQEFGKLLYYCYLGEYPVPNNYYFVAPKGCGTSLSKLLQNEEQLKEAIINNWDLYCKSKITKEPIELKDDFLLYVQNFNFRIFSKIHTKNIIEDHKVHSNHLTRFGGGLPERDKLSEDDIPDSIQTNETVYVKQLFKAYGSQNGEKYENKEQLDEVPHYSDHFDRARISFHHAEQLRNFSRDSLPVETFEDFQNEIFDGIVDIVDEDHSDGFVRVKEVEKEARKIVIASNPLKDVSIINDRSGICHQLANDKRITWT
ncbi:ABC-three component system protein [Zobellia laminariae]|uniref:ABC-three component system protein n=1 Tax=Zobellia laminariae TaxID=248906 RepID=UPI003EF9B900